MEHGNYTIAGKHRVSTFQLVREDLLTDGIDFCAPERDSEVLTPGTSLEMHHYYYVSAASEGIGEH